MLVDVAAWLMLGYVLNKAPGGSFGWLMEKTADVGGLFILLVKMTIWGEI